MKLFGSSENFLSTYLQIKCRDMERIVIEVSPNVAKAWRKMPEVQKRELGNEVSVCIAQKYLPLVGLMTDQNR
jgi:Trm5-related predicted tRNA methylase